MTAELLGCAERRAGENPGGASPAPAPETADKAVRSTVGIRVPSSRRAPQPRFADCSSQHPDPQSGSCGISPLCILSTEPSRFCLDSLGVLSSLEL